MAQTTSGPKWYEIGAEQYRRMRWEGKTAMPRPVVLDGDDGGEDMVLFPPKERDEEGMGEGIENNGGKGKERGVPVRVFRPKDGREVKGVFCHIHGGGWVLQSEKYQVG